MFTFWLQFHGGDSNTNPYLYDAPLDDLIEDLVIEKGHELSRDEIDFMLEVLVPYTVELVHAYYEDDVSEANAREHINGLENSFYWKHTWYVSHTAEQCGHESCSLTQKMTVIKDGRQVNVESTIFSTEETLFQEANTNHLKSQLSTNHINRQLL
jgi:hypothetical protein